MKRENLFKLAKLAKEKGFTTQTVTTNWTNNYLIKKGKDVFINSMCFYLWLCELRKWLGDRHNKYFSLDKKGEWCYCDREDVIFISEEEGLSFGCEMLLKNVKTTNDKN